MKETPHVVGIVGYPLDGTVSPAVHNAMFQRLGLPFVYLPFTVEPRHLPNLLRCMRLTDVEGLNVTMPHKTAVYRLLRRLTPEAKRIGAVNTLVLQGRDYVGHNTDGAGFLAALSHDTGETVAGKHVTLIGAGGAAAAVAYSLCKGGAAQVVIANRTLRQAAHLVRRLRGFFPRVRLEACALQRRRLTAHLATTDLLIQATGAPLTAPLPLAFATLSKRCIVADLRYGAKPTPLVQAAKRHRLRHVDGLS